LPRRATASTESPQSVSNRARRLAELGSKARKALPPELQPESVRALTDGMTGDDATATD